MFGLASQADLRRRVLARHLVGSGLEIGAGHAPFGVLPGTTVTYVDRWAPEEADALFPETAGHDVLFVAPDVTADLDIERLRMFEDCSQDFVIASHVLEHMAEPLGLIEDIHRVLRPGGTALILLPDRRRTFDKNRQPTPLAHLIEEHEAGVVSVSDEHVAEYMAGTGTPFTREQADEFDYQRSRSIHVHCWAPHEFAEVLRYTIAELGCGWVLVDAVQPVGRSERQPAIEFGFVLTRAPDTSSVLLERFDRTLNDLRRLLRGPGGWRPAVVLALPRVARIASSVVRTGARGFRRNRTSL